MLALSHMKKFIGALGGLVKIPSTRAGRIRLAGLVGYAVLSAACPGVATAIHGVLSAVKVALV